MSLPTDPNTAWPPSEPAADFTTWSAWYSGDLKELDTDAMPSGIMRRFLNFWARESQVQRRTTSGGSRPLHLPFAADLAMTSADLLFGEPVDFSVSGKAQVRLEEIVEQSGLHNSLLEAGEACAAIGGVYLRATWDPEIPYPFLTCLQADQAQPEWHWGRLAAVTFWRELERDGQKVWRHLERHAEQHIFHALYQGTPSTIGERRPLTARPETELLAEAVPLPSGLATDVWYVPNALPNRKVRTTPLGRPDIAGSEGALDALDETYSSLIRDIRLGKSRIIVPSGALTSGSKLGGRGGGKTFDTEADVFTELDGLKPDQANNLTVSQFQIRTEQHLGVAVDLVEKIASSAGYSPQTFGLHIDGRAESGTSLELRERKTYRTVKRKRRYWQPQLRALVATLLVLDAKVRGTRYDTLLPVVTWPAEVPSVSDQAATLNMLRSAESASTQTRVQMLHPDWDEQAVTEEVARIRAESGSVVPDPFMGA